MTHSVIVPATLDKLRPEVLHAIYAAGGDPWVWDLSGKPMGYWRLVRDRWAAGDDLTIVEHDIVIPPNALADFDACPRPYCFHSFELFLGDVEQVYEQPGLGCVRFRSELLAAVPFTVPEMTWNGEDQVGLDTRLWQMLKAAGYGPHRHEPRAEHLHQYRRDDVAVQIRFRDGRFTMHMRGIGEA